MCMWGGGTALACSVGGGWWSSVACVCREGCAWGGLWRAPGARRVPTCLGRRGATDQPARGHAAATSDTQQRPAPRCVCAPRPLLLPTPLPPPHRTQVKLTPGKTGSGIRFAAHPVHDKQEYADLADFAARVGAEGYYGGVRLLMVRPAWPCAALGGGVEGAWGGGS